MPRGPILGFDVQGEQQVRLSILRVQNDLKDLRPLWKRWRAVFYVIEEALFESEGATGRGGSWPDLTPAYAAWKATHWPGGSILVASGAMRASLTGRTGDSVYRATPKHFEIGTSRLAGYHFGGLGHNKVRRPIDVGRDAELEFGDALHEWAIKDISQHWRGK